MKVLPDAFVSKTDFRNGLNEFSIKTSRAWCYTFSFDSSVNKAYLFEPYLPHSSLMIFQLEQGSGNVNGNRPGEVSGGFSWSMVLEFSVNQCIHLIKQLLFSQGTMYETKFWRRDLIKMVETRKLHVISRQEKRVSRIGNHSSLLCSPALHYTVCISGTWQNLSDLPDNRLIRFHTVSTRVWRHIGFRPLDRRQEPWVTVCYQHSNRP